MTPGQQLAELCLVTAKDLRDAPRRAEELRILHPPRDRMMLAALVKARELAAGLGCEPRDAWLLLDKAREALMPYVHQRRPQAPAEKSDREQVVAFLIPEGGETQALEITDETDLDTVELVEQVGQSKSDGCA